MTALSDSMATSGRNSHVLTAKTGSNVLLTNYDTITEENS